MRKIFMVLGVAAFAFAACTQSKNEGKPAINLANFDNTVSAGEDFYQYACGGWMAANPLTPEYARYGIFDQLDKENQEKIKVLIDEVNATAQEAGSVGEKIQIMYAMGLDTARRNADGAAPVLDKINEIKAVADRCTIIRKGRYVDTVNVADVSKDVLSEKMVGHKVNFIVDKDEAKPTDTVLKVDGLTYQPKGANKPLLNNVSFEVKKGEIVCIAGIDGNGQSELVYNISGIEKPTAGHVYLNGQDITTTSIRERNDSGMAVIPEDRHKHGLVLDYSVAENMILKSYYKPEFEKHGFIDFDAMNAYSDKLIEQYDVRSGEGSKSIARGMSGGNQQKAIVAREIESDSDLLIAVQPTRGLDVGAIEFIHKQIVKHRDSGHAVLLVSLELDEVMTVSDRILVMYEGEIVADVNPKDIDVKELGLYMAGSKRGIGYEK
jgi:simple sugar transport system ATP-binding protein